jgi:hypothetical protein
MEIKLKKVLEWVLEKGWNIDQNGQITNPKGEIKKGSLTYGYLKVGIKITELQISSYALKIHKFQAYKKYGEEIFNPGIVVRHLNGIKTDNSWENIIIGTQSDNMMDRNESDRIKHSKERRKYSQEVKSQLIKERELGKSFGQISKDNSIPLQSVKDIIKKSLI